MYNLALFDQSRFAITVHLKLFQLCQNRLSSVWWEWARRGFSEDDSGCCYGWLCDLSHLTLLFPSPLARPCVGHALFQVLGERFLFLVDWKGKNRVLGGDNAKPYPQRKEGRTGCPVSTSRPCLRAATWLCSVIWIKRLELKENRATYESPESLLFLKICPYFYNSSNLINEASSLVWVIQGDSLGSSSFEAILISRAIHCLHLLCFIWFGFHLSSQFYII